MIVVVSPCALLAICDLPAVAACFIGEVRIIHIFSAILPDDCDEAEVKALEKRLQIQKTHRAEYKWHNKAAMMKEERENLLPIYSAFMAIY